LGKSKELIIEDMAPFGKILLMNYFKVQSYLNETRTFEIQEK